MRSMTVVTRFAPSPTGLLHIGGVRTALFSWLQARRHGGKFILRVEDTDIERSTPEAVKVILQGMTWLGLDTDEGPYYQTRRFERYRAVIQQLLVAGKAYRCYCTKEELDALRAEQMARKEKPRYDGRWRERTGVRVGVEPVIRFKNPLEGDVIVQDLVHGPVRFANHELDDLVIARSDGTPTYNFCVVVDDMDMGITHVIRGDDHLNNTPRQMNMLLALGVTPPIYAHVPMILGADGAKLSKRHGAVSVLAYEEEGYLPDALLNYLVRLGWSHGDQEIFTRQQMIDAFDIGALGKSASAFNPEKLLWLNQQHLMHSDPQEIVPHLRKFLQRLGVQESDDTRLLGIIVAQRERSRTLKEMAQASLFFFQDFAVYDEKAAKKNLTADAAPLMQAVLVELQSLPIWQTGPIHEAINAVAMRGGVALGKVAQPLRVAISGAAVSPPIDVTLALLGRESAFGRIERAIAHAVR